MGFCHKSSPLCTLKTGLWTPVIWCLIVINHSGSTLWSRSFTVILLFIWQPSSWPLHWALLLYRKLKLLVQVSLYPSSLYQEGMTHVSIISLNAFLSTYVWRWLEWQYSIIYICMCEHVAILIQCDWVERYLCVYIPSSNVWSEL